VQREGITIMKLVHRAAVVLATGALVLTTAGTAQAATVDTSADWLTRQLTGGVVHNDQFDIDDYGLTADAALALKTIGGHGTAVRQIRNALAAHVDSWTTGVDYGSDDVYAGAVAKAVVVAEATGADPRTFGGVDLVKRLQQRVSATSATVGRISDKSAYGDYANTIGQSFAARGLASAGASKAPSATKFLLQQQCSPGFFRLNFAAPTAARQGCDAGTATQSAPDTDVTALALLNLKALPRKSSAVKAAISDAAGWLKRNQKTNGSFGGGPATEASNSNSTGLAGWALGSTGACKQAAKAAAWVRDLTVRGDVSGTPLAGEKGAIAYDRGAYDAARTDGITTQSQDQWRRATTQAAPALANLSAASCTAR
jgi:hypothetical protein